MTKAKGKSGKTSASSAIVLPSPLVLPAPDAAISFSQSLEALRSQVLDEALHTTVAGMNIVDIDKDLAAHVPPHRMAELAGRGIRGEMVYAVPCILKANPKLLGYYRLLLGFSAKKFYRTGSPLARFKTMEEKGTISPVQSPHIDAVCDALVASAESLVDGVGIGLITQQLLHELQLLTLGSQFQGARNVDIGTAGMQEVKDLIDAIIAPHVVSATPHLTALTNAAGRTVEIRVSQDPDVRITEILGNTTKTAVAIEVKAGGDASNIYNRLGEAEKSHLKAKAKGFTEFWTIVNTKDLNLTKAREQSPHTHQFYLLSRLKDSSTPEYADFRSRIEAVCGIPSV